MGKRILQRRRGKGGLQWRVSSRGKIAPVRYPLMNPDASGHEGKLTVKALLDAAPDLTVSANLWGRMARLVSCRETEKALSKGRAR